MINSLFKDSHITHYNCRPLSYNSNKSMYESTPNVVKEESSKINVNKSARNLNFCGLSSYKLADSNNFKTLFNNVKTFMGEKGNDNKNIKEFLINVTKVVRNVENKSGEDVKEFANKHKEQISSFIEQTKTLMAKENVKEDAEHPEIYKNKITEYLNNFWTKSKSCKEFDENIEGAVDKLPIMSNKGKPNSIYTNKHAQSFFKLADKSAAVFSALFALGLTCVLRPAAIMSLPGKKNKDDKIYASGHSIASGVIGYLISLAIFKPISKSVEKIVNDPEKFLSKKSYLLEDKKAMEAAKNCLNLLPEAILAAPRATVTIALIPPILKYVFGYEKKKTNTNDLSPILQNYAAINFKSANTSNKIGFQKLMEGSK